MKLEDIGFYTLSDSRAEYATEKTPLTRCELILTGRCNFKCPYCRAVGGPDLPIIDASKILNGWTDEGLNNVRFSGGEPTLYQDLNVLVKHCSRHNVNRIAISTNGSASYDVYAKLVDSGVNDFSISLDSCCAKYGDLMSGTSGHWDTVVDNIQRLSSLTYVTAGIVITNDNLDSVYDIVKFADKLGVSDIRIIPAAQYSAKLSEIELLEISRNPILEYRINNAHKGIAVRGLADSDSNRCGLVLDDMAVQGNYHYPCIIYMREGGSPIGRMDTGNIRQERLNWLLEHNTHSDKICRHNCLDVCRDYNNTFDRINRKYKI